MWERVRLEQDAGVDFVGAVEVLRQRRVPEQDGLLVQRIAGQREGVVGRRAAAEDTGEGAEEVEVVVVDGGYTAGGGGGGRGCTASCVPLARRQGGVSCWAHSPYDPRGPLDSYQQAHELEKDLRLAGPLL